MKKGKGSKGLRMSVGRFGDRRMGHLACDFFSRSSAERRKEEKDLVSLRRERKAGSQHLGE